MRESDLFPPVRDWLKARGWEVHAEMYGCDIVAVQEGRLLVVELKLYASLALFRQMSLAALWADEVIGAIGSVTTRLPGFRSGGFGLLQVIDGKVRQRVKPRQQPWQREKMRAYRFKWLKGRPPVMDHELAGLKACRELREQREKRNARILRERESGDGRTGEF